MANATHEHLSAEAERLIAHRPLVDFRARDGDTAAVAQLDQIDARLAQLERELATALAAEAQTERDVHARTQQAEADERELRDGLAGCYERVEAALDDLVAALMAARGVLQALDNAVSRQGDMPMTMPSQAGANTVRGRLSCRLGTVPNLRGLTVTGAAAPSLVDGGC